MENVTLNDDISEEKKKEIGKRLAGLRTEYGKKLGLKHISQEDFARRLGLDANSSNLLQKNMSQIEQGKVVYRLPLLLRYAHLCDVSLEYIIDGTVCDDESTSSERDITFSIADLCKEIVKLDECGLIDFISVDGREGILFRDIEEEVNNTDYGAFEYVAPNGEKRCVPKDVPYLDEIKAVYTGVILSFISNYHAVKQIGSMIHGEQAKQLALKGAYADVDIYDTFSTDSLLKEIEWERANPPIDLQQLLDDGSARFAEAPSSLSSLPKAGDTIHLEDGREVIVESIIDNSNNKGQQA